MSDALQKLIKEMEAPLNADAVNFLQMIDAEKPEFFSATFHTSKNPLQIDEGLFKFELTYTPPEIIEFNIPWTPKFEAELYRRHVRMSAPEFEAIRGGYLLLSNLRFPGIKYGEDYSNSVLVEVIRERFGSIEVIESLLNEIREYNPSKGASYLECRNYLKSAIDGYGNSLVLELHYKDKTAFGILVGALVVMLDKRFRISLRKVLFPK